MKKSKGVTRVALIRTVAMIMITVIIVCLASSYTVSRINTDYTLKTLNSIKTDLLHLYARQFEEKLTTLSRQVDLLMLNNDIWKLIYTAPEETDFVTVKSALDVIKTSTYTNNLIHSTYLFDRTHDYVLSDYYYHKDGFFDPFVLTDEFLQQGPVTSVRTVGGSQLFSIIYQPLVAPQANPVTIVSNISSEKIASLFSFSPFLGSFVITNSRGEILYATSDDITTAMIADARSLQDNQDQIRSDHDTYLVTKETIQPFDLGLYIFQDHHDAAREISLMQSLVIPAVIIILLASACIVLVVSHFLYRPLKQLLAGLGISERPENEYQVIDEAFRSLDQSRKDIESKYHSLSEFSEKYMLHEFLLEPVFNEARFEQLLQHMNLCFDAPEFTLFLIEIQKTADDTALQDLPVPPARLFDTMEYITCSVHYGRIVILVNHSKYCSDLMAQLADKIREMYTSLQYRCSVIQSDSFDQLSVLPDIYQLSLKMLSQEHQGTEATAAAWHNLPDLQMRIEKEKRALFAAIRESNSEAAYTKLSEIVQLFTGYFSSSDAGLARHYLCDLYLEIMEMSSDNITISEKDMNQFRNALNTDGISDLESLLNSLLDKTLTYYMSLRKNRNQDIINTAKAFIENHLTSDVSLDDIAQSVYLSTTYFCGIFKAETGSTVMEYVTARKIELARKKLSDNPDITVNEIAQQLGYNSAQSFIRQFKKHTGTTPDRFRKGIS